MIAVDIGIPLHATIPKGCNRVRKTAIETERLQSRPFGLQLRRDYNPDGTGFIGA